MFLPPKLELTRVRAPNEIVRALTLEAWKVFLDNVQGLAPHTMSSSNTSHDDGQVYSIIHGSIEVYLITLYKT